MNAGTVDRPYQPLLEWLAGRTVEFEIHEHGPAYTARATAAAEGVDYHAPLKTSPKLQRVHNKVRALSPHFTADRYWADDMAALQAAVLAGEFGGELLD